MTIDADYLLDRRRLKRSLTTWRVLAVAAAVGAVLLALPQVRDQANRPHVARLTVTGIIFDDPRRDKAIEDLGEDNAVKAVILRIDSPGGTVVGGQMLYQKVRRLAENKPVVAVMGELGTSAAYMTALGADRIFAQAGTITGSIGVILQSTDLTGLLDKLGIKPDAVKSSPLKAQPNPFEPFTAEAREATRQVIMSMYEMFVGLVAERRNLDRPALQTLADGRVFTGQQAKDSGLIDAVGGEDAARRWLSDEKGVPVSLPVRDVEIRDEETPLDRLLSLAFGNSFIPERLKLDGLISVWQPGL